MRNRALVVVGALLAASVWCCALLVVRARLYGFDPYQGMVWNLFLAWIPFALALLLLAGYRRGRSALELVAIGAAWLVFLPNAPYMLTDFVHLGYDHRLYDSFAIASFAVTGLALGFASLLVVQLVVTRAAGALGGWLVAGSALFLSSVGIYLGRVQRLNSWDVLSRPHVLAALARTKLDDPLGNRHLIGFVVAVCGFLTLTYLAVYGAAQLAASLRRDG